MKGAWKLALRGLGRNRRRSLATGVAIALGYAGLVLLGGYILGVNDYLRTVAVYVQGSGHLAIYKKDGLELHRVRPARYSLTAEDQAAVAQVLAADANVELALPYLLGTGMVGNGCKSVPFTARGVDPELERRVRTHAAVMAVAPALARPLRGAELASHPELEHPLALSTGLARILGKTRVVDELPRDAPADTGILRDCETPEAARRIAADATVQLSGSGDLGGFSAMDGDMVGVISTGMTATEDSTVVTSLQALQELYGTDRVTYVAVYLKDASDAAARATALEAALKARGVDASVYAFNNPAVNPFYMGTVGFLTVMAGFMGLVVFAVVALSILNSMTLSIIERTREMGTLRSLGFTRGQMLGLFLREGVVLAALGVGAGLVLALGTALVVNARDIRVTPPGVPGTMQLVLTPAPALCVGLAVVLGTLALLATFVATRRRTRENIARLMTALSA
jgi:ABC-type lipoprotein release transport system permease subunit